MSGDEHLTDAASWLPLDSGAWYEARDATALLRDVLIAADLAEHLPYLRADVNAFGHGFVELGRTTPAAAKRIASLIALALADHQRDPSTDRETG